MAERNKQMKCNIKNKINNSMARVFGDDFNFSNEEIIEIIEKIYKLEAIDTNLRHEHVEVALYNCDYYIRPGKDKELFMEQFQNIFNQAKADFKVIPEWMAQWHCSIALIELIKQRFDEKYFNEQVKRRKTADDSACKDKLESYIKKLDNNQLKYFLTLIVSYRLSHGLFVSNNASTAFWAEIHEECRKRGYKTPYCLDTEEGKRFLINNNFYYFKILDKDTIATKLCDAIDLDVTLAEALAEKFYECGYEAATQYLNTMLNNRHHA
jgi:hypothetical protein